MKVIMLCTPLLHNVEGSLKIEVLKDHKKGLNNLDGIKHMLLHVTAFN